MTAITIPILTTPLTIGDCNEACCFDGLDDAVNRLVWPASTYCSENVLAGDTLHLTYEVTFSHETGRADYDDGRLCADTETVCETVSVSLPATRSIAVGACEIADCITQLINDY